MYMYICAAVLPIKSTETPDMLAGMKKGLQKIGDKVKVFYSDEECLYSETAIEFLEM